MGNTTNYFDGDNATVVNRADRIIAGQVNIEKAVFQIDSAPSSAYAPPTPGRRDFYSLFVIPEEAVRKRMSVINCNRCLMGERELSGNSGMIMTDGDEDFFSCVQGIPAIVCAPNRYYGGRAGESQYAVLAAVTRITHDGDSFAFEYHEYCRIPQQRLNALGKKIGIEPYDGVTELNETHWAIKPVDIRNVLHEAGLPNFPE